MSAAASGGILDHASVTMDDPAKPRIVLHGIGQFGGHLARLAVSKGWPIVAAYNRAGAKIGRDLGRLVGLDHDLGIVVQDSAAADCAGLQADIALVTASDSLRVNLPDYRRYMAAGMNVLCHGGQSYFPAGSDPETAATLDALAKQHGVTFTGGGIWDMSRIWSGMLAAGPAHELNSLFHSSITDVGGMIVTREQALQGGLSMTLEEFRSTRADAEQSPIAFYKTIPQHVLWGLGYTLGETRVRLEPVTFDHAVAIGVFDTPIPAGRCVGTRFVCEVDTLEGLTARAEIELRLFRPGEIEHMFWSVDGKPRTSVRTERRDSALASASCLFNRIRDVIAAPPGIVPVAKLGPLTHSARA